VSRQTIDMLAQAHLPAASRWRWMRVRTVPALALVTGVVAGVIAGLAQFVLWWLADMPLADTFLQDVRLTAALVMGTGVLHSAAAPFWTMLLVATITHFFLSFIYALIPLCLFGRLRTGPALVAGALYGLALYAINLYGFTFMFPWFAVDRNWVTLLTHLLFGIALAGGCRLFSARRDYGVRYCLMSFVR
jgi:hypothetical protein